MGTRTAAQSRGGASVLRFSNEAFSDETYQEEKQFGWIIICISFTLGSLLCAAVIGALYSADYPPETSTFFGVTPITGFGHEPAAERSTSQITKFPTKHITPNAPGDTTTYIETSTIERAPKADPYSLLCTVSNQFQPESSLPEDGLCDFIFYESLYRDNKNPVEGPYSPGLQYFLELPHTMRRTSFGVSFDAGDYKFLSASRETHFFPAIDNLTGKGVLHFGVLDVHRDEDIHTLHVWQLGIKLEETRRHVQAKLRNSATSLTVIGIACRGFVCADDLLSWLRRHPPSLLVSVSHLNYIDHEAYTCTILPPTILRIPEGKQPDYYSSWIDLIKGTNEAKVLYQGVNVPVSISFTMQAQIFQPDSDNFSFEFFSGCIRRFIGLDTLPPYTICHSYNPLKYDEVTASVYAENIVLNRTATFDTEFTMAKKICQIKFLEDNIILPFSIAVYDIEYDADDAACPKLNLSHGTFRRVRMLKKMRDFLRGVSYNRSTLQECSAVSF